ncbi:hypothetical protein B0H16DRAFT_1463569 [Mycena metata]|uniref:Uncharacterized protein n=1 Tax=Mycena metata TaxID=1033252 RepID=A0AAD7IHY4_9AGAR|nr:hypothetical protein B0H16DRAFT_1463569 [Mycena metata]
MTSTATARTKGKAPPLGRTQDTRGARTHADPDRVPTGGPVPRAPRDRKARRREGGREGGRETRMSFMFALAYTTYFFLGEVTWAHIERESNYYLVPTRKWLAMFHRRELNEIYIDIHL